MECYVSYVLHLNCISVMLYFDSHEVISFFRLLLTLLEKQRVVVCDCDTKWKNSKRRQGTKINKRVKTKRNRGDKNPTATHTLVWLACFTLGHHCVCKL